MNKKVPRLISNFIPLNYDLTLDPDRESKRLTGTVIVTGKKTGRPSQRLTFHQHEVKVTRASITKHDKKGDKEITVSRINHLGSADEVRLHTEEMLYPGSYTVTMEFKGSVQDSMHGVYLSSYELDGKKLSVVSTQFESHYAREAFPCIDEPEAKATFDLTLLSPVGETSLSNMPAKSQEEKDGKSVTIFEQTPKMSTYLLAFVYGDLHSKTITTKEGVIASIYATKANSPESLDFALTVAKRSLEFYNDYYGVPYPLKKSDHVAIPNFSVGAMENWGLITYRETCLIMDPASASQGSREVITLVMSHELAHMWFGDLVTMKWWNNLWLNESFANVMEYVAMNSLHPEWHIMDSYVAQEGLSALRRDCIAGVQPVQTDVASPTEISTLFDPSIVYAKGGRLMSMLMNYVGTDDFRKGLKEYFTKYAYGNTTGDDLWKALSNASGKDISVFMKPWITMPGYPVVEVTQKGKKLHLNQRHFLLDMRKADPDRVWLVPLLGGNELPELFDKKTLDIDMPSEGFAHIDRGAIGHYVVHYTEPDHQDNLAQRVANKELNVSERLMLLHDSSQLSRAGVQSFAETLKLLGHYEHEDSDPVWDIMSLALGDARRFVDVDKQIDDKIKAWVRELIEEQYQRLGWEEKTDEPSDDTKLRAGIIGLGVYSGHPEIMAEAKKQYEQYKQNPDSVSAELRGVIFGAVVKAQIDGVFDYLLDLEEKTNDVQLKQDLQGALTGTKSVDEAKVLLGRMTNPEKVRSQDVGHWLVYLQRNRHTRDITWRWVRDNWKWIEKTFKNDMTFDSLPRYSASAFSTPEKLKEYKEFFGSMADDPQLSRNIAMGIEEIENRIAWLGRDLSAVQTFFKL